MCTTKFKKHLLVMQIENIFKRSHEKRPFKLEKITDAILKAMISVKNGDLEDAEKIANDVNKNLIACN